MSRFLKGKLYIECRGDCERLLCRCAEHNISLWNIERTDELNMRCCLAASAVLLTPPDMDLRPLDIRGKMPFL